MTEKTLFKNTLMTLGSTVVVPLVVGLSGLGAPNGVATNTLINDHVNRRAVAMAPSTDQSSQPTKDTANDTKTPAADTSKNPPDATKQDASSAPKLASVKAAGTYTVKAGDTYGCIAEQYYGSYDQWSRVYAENAGWPGFEEYHLHVGAVLKMPAVTAADLRLTTDICP